MEEPIDYRPFIGVTDEYYGDTSMRAAFNKEMTVRYGPRSTAGPPGVTYASGIPCRRVPQTRIAQGQFDFSLTQYWVTQDTVVLNPPAVLSPWLGAFFTDQLTADEVAFNDDPAVWYSVCRHEEVNPYRGADYWRDLIIPVSAIAYPPWPPPTPLPPAPPPPPVPPVAPGRDCGEAAELTDPAELSLMAYGRTEPGYYRFFWPHLTRIRISLAEPFASATSVNLSYTAPDGDCCSAVNVGTIERGVTECVSEFLPDYDDDFVLVCLRVTYFGEDEVPELVGVLVEALPCP